MGWLEWIFFDVVANVSLICKGTRVHQPADLFAEKIHDEDGADHAAVTEGRPAVESRKARLRIDGLPGLDKVPVDGALDIALHTGLDGVEGMRHVATKETTQKRGGNTGLVVRVKGRWVRFHKGSADNRGDAQVPAGPQRLSDCHAQQTSRKIDGLLGNLGEPGSTASALALLLDHDQFQGGSHKRRERPSGNSAAHFFREGKLVTLVAPGDGVFELSAHDELDHRTGSHVDTVREDTAVHDARAHRNRTLLLDHVFGIIEGLQNQNLDHTDRHTDGSILLPIQFFRHFQ